MTMNPFHLVVPILLLISTLHANQMRVAEMQAQIYDFIEPENLEVDSEEFLETSQKVSEPFQKVLGNDIKVNLSSVLDKCETVLMKIFYPADSRMTIDDFIEKLRSHEDDISHLVNMSSIKITENDTINFMLGPPARNVTPALIRFDKEFTKGLADTSSEEHKIFMEYVLSKLANIIGTENLNINITGILKGPVTVTFEIEGIDALKLQESLQMAMEEQSFGDLLVSDVKVPKNITEFESFLDGIESYPDDWKLNISQIIHSNQNEFGNSSSPPPPKGGHHPINHTTEGDMESNPGDWQSNPKTHPNENEFGNYFSLLPPKGDHHPINHTTEGDMESNPGDWQSNPETHPNENEFGNYSSLRPPKGFKFHLSLKREFNADLFNLDSPAYKALSEEVIAAMTSILSDISNINLIFSNGSTNVDGKGQLPPDSNETADSLQTKLEDGAAEDKLLDAKPETINVEDPKPLGNTTDRDNSTTPSMHEGNTTTTSSYSTNHTDSTNPALSEDSPEKGTTPTGILTTNTGSSSTHEEKTTTMTSSGTKEDNLTTTKTTSESGSTTEEKAATESGSTTKQNAETESGSTTEQNAETESGSTTEQNAETESSKTTEQNAETESGSTTEQNAETESGSTTEEKAETESSKTTEQNAETESSKTTEQNAETESSKTTEQNAETESSKTTEQNAETESSKTTEQNAETESSKTTEQNAETESSKTTEQNAETESSKTTEQNAETESSKTTEQNAETESSKTTEHNAETESSKTTEHNAETESSKTTEQSADADTENSKTTQPFTANAASEPGRTDGSTLSTDKDGSTGIEQMTTPHDGHTNHTGGEHQSTGSLGDDYSKFHTSFKLRRVFMDAFSDPQSEDSKKLKSDIIESMRQNISSTFKLTGIVLSPGSVKVDTEIEVPKEENETASSIQEKIEQGAEAGQLLDADPKSVRVADKESNATTTEYNSTTVDPEISENTSKSTTTVDGKTTTEVGTPTDTTQKGENSDGTTTSMKEESKTTANEQETTSLTSTTSADSETEGGTSTQKETEETTNTDGSTLSTDKDSSTGTEQMTTPHDGHTNHTGEEHQSTGSLGDDYSRFHTSFKLRRMFMDAFSDPQSEDSKKLKSDIIESMRQNISSTFKLTGIVLSPGSVKVDTEIEVPKEENETASSIQEKIEQGAEAGQLLDADPKSVRVADKESNATTTEYNSTTVNPEIGENTGNSTTTVDGKTTTEVGTTTDTTQKGENSDGTTTSMQEESKTTANEQETPSLTSTTSADSETEVGTSTQKETEETTNTDGSTTSAMNEEDTATTKQTSSTDSDSSDENVTTKEESSTTKEGEKTTNSDQATTTRNGNDIMTTTIPSQANSDTTDSSDKSTSSEKGSTTSAQDGKSTDTDGDAKSSTEADGDSKSSTEADEDSNSSTEADEDSKSSTEADEDSESSAEADGYESSTEASDAENEGYSPTSTIVQDSTMDESSITSTTTAPLFKEDNNTYEFVVSMRIEDTWHPNFAEPSSLESRAYNIDLKKKVIKVCEARLGHGSTTVGDFTLSRGSVKANGKVTIDTPKSTPDVEEKLQKALVSAKSDSFKIDPTAVKTNLEAINGKKPEEDIISKVTSEKPKVQYTPKTLRETFPHFESITLPSAIAMIVLTVCALCIFSAKSMGGETTKSIA